MELSWILNDPITRYFIVDRSLERQSFYLQRRDYEDKMSRAFANPKFYDRKIISNQLDRLFNSIRLQMQFLVKCLLGRRWKDIMKSLEEEEKNSKRKLAEGQEGNAGEADSGGETSNEMGRP